MVPLDILSVVGYALALLLMIVLWACIVWNVRRVAVASRLVGSPILQSAIHAFRLKLRTRHRWIAGSAAILAIVLPFALYLANSVAAVGFVLVGISFQLFLISEYIVPPCVLLLGPTRYETTRLFCELHRRLFPYRTVFLLDDQYSGLRRISRLALMEFTTNNLRTTTNTEWTSVVDDLTRNVFAVVLDGRFSTDAVVHEAGLVCRDATRLRRTIFVCQDNGTCPALEAAVSVLPAGVQLRTAADTPQALAGLGLQQRLDVDSVPWFFIWSYNRAATSIGHAMLAVQKAGAPLGAALFEYSRQHGSDRFANDLMIVLRSIEGVEGDGATEVMKSLLDDTDAIERFLRRWTTETASDRVELIRRCEKLLSTLQQLQLAYDRTPDAVLDDMEQRLPRNPRRTPVR